MILTRGHRAPDFALTDHRGETVRLRELAGPKAVFFFPTAFSFYCGNKLPGMDALAEDMVEAGLRHFLGISRESVFANRHFAEILGLERYRLLSDLDSGVARQWGTFIPRGTQRVNKRAFFVLDGEDVVRHSHDVTLQPAEFDLNRLLAELPALLDGPAPEPEPWDGPVEDVEEDVQSPTPEVGETAPEFEVMDYKMNPVSITQYRGRKVVLVFYQYDFNPPCSEMLAGLAAARDAFDERGAVVLAINRDNPYTHAAWAEEMGFIGAHLLSDMNSAVARRWGLYLGGPERAHRKAVFVLDEEGKVMWRALFEQQDTILPAAEILSLLDRAAAGDRA